MVTLRCTRKLLRFLHIQPVPDPPAPTGALGDWYANLIPTCAGDLIIFVNERSLATVALPAARGTDLLRDFRLRVTNLFAGYGVNIADAARELSHLLEIQFSTTKSRTILGSMNDIAFQFQVMAEAPRAEGESLSLSDAEQEIGTMPCSPIGYECPARVATDLLRDGVQGTS